MRATQAKRYAAEVKRKNKKLDQDTIKLITGTADETNRKILRRGKPDLQFPVDGRRRCGPSPYPP